MDNIQIEKWILEGLTDDEIQVKLDKIEEDKHAPSDEALLFMTAIDDEEDEPGAAPGPATDTIQGTVTRLVSIIDKTVTDYEAADANTLSSAKTYTDGKFSELITLTFDDGSTEVIKVGK